MSRNTSLVLADREKSRLNLQDFPSFTTTLSVPAFIDFQMTVHFSAGDTRRIRSEKKGSGNGYIRQKKGKTGEDHSPKRRKVLQMRKEDQRGAGIHVHGREDILLLMRKGKARLGLSGDDGTL